MSRLEVKTLLNEARYGHYLHLRDDDTDVQHQLSIRVTVAESKQSTGNKHFVWVLILKKF